MRTKTIQLYKFEELNKEAQEKAIEKVRENPHYLEDDWWDFMHEDFHERLKEIGIECKEFYWDFERGKYFRMDEARIVDEQLFLTSAGLQKELILLSLEGYNNYGFIRVDISEHRERTNSVEVEYDCSEDEDEEKIKEILGTYDDLSEKLTDYLQNILEGYLKELDNEYDYMGSDEYIREDLINRDDEYNEDGERE